MPRAAFAARGEGGMGGGGDQENGPEGEGGVGWVDGEGGGEGRVGGTRTLREGRAWLGENLPRPIVLD